MLSFKKFVTSFSVTAVTSSCILLCYFFISSPKVMASKETSDKLENTLYLYLPAGKVIIEMLPDKAPKHVTRIKELVRKGFYDGLAFHRVINGFMAQGGDPKGDGTGGSGKNIPAEFSKLTHKRGAVSMARANDPDSGDSQFFIVTHDSLFLDGKYTIWGYVIGGMELERGSKIESGVEAGMKYVDKLKKGGQHNNGMVSQPDKIIKMIMAIDEEKANLKSKK